MEYRLATLNDIESILELHKKYQVDTIKEEDKKDGFVTTNFTKDDLKELIEKEQGLFIAVEKSRVLAYVMSASWEYCSRWDIFKEMIEDLPNIEYKGYRLSTKNSYQYGPISIDKSVRGSEVLPNIFNFALEMMSKKYPVMVTFVNKINPRSFNAHHKKLGLDILKEFEFNGNRYWELGCLTKGK